MTNGKSAVEELREAIRSAASALRCAAGKPTEADLADGIGRYDDMSRYLRALPMLDAAAMRLDELRRDLDMACELGYEAATRDAEARLRALVSIHDVAGQAKRWLLAAADDIQNGGHVGAATRPRISP